MAQKREYLHIKAQREGKNREFNTCQICGNSKATDTKVQGHHIIDYCAGGPPSVENIVTLCEEHHKKVHRNKIEIFRF